jgi:hypothetical protein
MDGTPQFYGEWVGMGMLALVPRFCQLHVSFACTSGSCNAAFGAQAGYTASTGLANTFMGSFAGYSLTTGSFNTFIGQSAGGNMDLVSARFAVLMPPLNGLSVRYRRRIRHG